MGLSTIYQQIILASSSKARIEYLRQKEIDFEVRPHKIDESVIKRNKKTFLEIVEELAEMKARSVMGGKKEIIIGSDQVLICDQKLMNKPDTIEEAKYNLLFLRNKEHKLISSVVVVSKKKIIFKETSEAILRMRNVSEVQYLE